jgi:hypothetical protein
VYLFANHVEAQLSAATKELTTTDEVLQARAEVLSRELGITVELPASGEEVVQPQASPKKFADPAEFAHRNR